jgi:hypothetical protein
MGSGTATCTGVLNLTLTQADTVLTGQYAVPDGSGCDDSGTGLSGSYTYGFVTQCAITFVVRASGDVRLSPATAPNSLVLIGRPSAERVDGVASFAIHFTSAVGASSVFHSRAPSFSCTPQRWRARCLTSA